MAEGDSEVVRRIYEAWGRGDFRSPAALFSDDVEFTVRPGIPDPGTWYGLDGLEEYTRYFLGSWRDLRLDGEIVEAGARCVLVRVRQTGAGRRSGAAGVHTYFHVWELRDGVPARLEVIADEAEAREAAGLAARE